ncbi:hypothetical protein [Nostoc sp.]|uniref:hypothetical protein n=1 Tax=Nostoc sp. TaxID=1180 RepID=UPI002FF9BE34
MRRISEVTSTENICQVSVISNSPSDDHTIGINLTLKLLLTWCIEADNPIGAEIQKYKETLKKNVDGSGKQLLNGKHLQNKLMSKVANLLFRELSRAIALP